MTNEFNDNQNFTENTPTANEANIDNTPQEAVTVSETALPSTTPDPVISPSGDVTPPDLNCTSQEWDRPTSTDAPYTPPVQNSYVWSDATNVSQQKKPASRGKVFAYSMLSFLLIALIILASFGVIYIVKGIPEKSSPGQPSSSSESVEMQTGFDTVSRNESDEASVKDVASKVRPAVVGVVNYNMNSLTAAGYGSGVIINADGYIVTNQHVIDGADRVKVVLHDETEVLATIVGADEQTDLAVLRIIEDENTKYSDLTYATFGNSDELQLAETVIAIGNPGGLEFAGTVTRGIVSSIGVKSTLSGNMGLIQTDAAINPGNSGGPLIDLYGNVIGITSQKIVNVKYEGIGFAIPINAAKPIIDNLITYGYVPGRPMLGITGSTIDEYVAYFNGVPQGVLISEIEPDSDLVKKGVKKNDIITSIGGVTIKTMDELNEEKEKYSAGDTIELGIHRYSENRSFTVKIVLSEYKPTDQIQS